MEFSTHPDRLFRLENVSEMKEPRRNAAQWDPTVNTSGLLEVEFRCLTPVFYEDNKN